MFTVITVVIHSFESKPHKSLNYQIHITFHMVQMTLSYSIIIYLSPTVQNKYFHLCFIISPLHFSLERERN